MNWQREPCATCGGDASKGGVVPGPDGACGAGHKVFCREHYPQGEPTMVKAKKSRKRTSKASVRANGGMAVHQEPVERRRFKDQLPCRIDDATVALKAAQLASFIHKREALRVERREANAVFREKLSYFDETLQDLATSVDLHTETRPVDCVERLTAQNEIETVRLDTGEIVDTRPAEAADLQESLPGTDDDGDEKDDDDWSEGANPKPSRHAAADGATAP
jgi:hypothetical protein